MYDRDSELEELVLKECLVSATGLTSESLQIGIRGDPSLRETSMERKRYLSSVDELFPELEPNLEDVLINRSVYKLFVGFNNAEIRTQSIFDPLREEVHAAERMVDRGYIERHFPAIPFQDKVEGMREIYDNLRSSTLYAHLPGYWRNIFQRRRESWQPMGEQQLSEILSTLKVLRDMPEYYLRNVTISIIQGLVRMQFNCDGTQIVRADNFKRFLEENLPG